VPSSCPPHHSLKRRITGVVRCICVASAWPRLWCRGPTIASLSIVTIHELAATPIRSDGTAVSSLVDAYRTCPVPDDRAEAIGRATRFARHSDEAFELGLEALRDRSSRVRGRACGLLAYSLRQDAVGRLMLLLNHADAETRDDAQAALDAILEQNHHLFKDRDRSGRVFWVVDTTDLTQL
jgi:hypothetical protein